MKTESEWLACKPLAFANLPSWVRAIQADALRHAATTCHKHDGHSMFAAGWLERAAEQLEATQTEVSAEVPDKNRQFHQLVELACAYRTTLEELLEAYEDGTMPKEEQRLREVTALLNEIHRKE